MSDQQTASVADTKKPSDRAVAEWNRPVDMEIHEKNRQDFRHTGWNTQIGDFIYDRRNALGMSVEELAAKVEVSNAAVAHWEVGRYYPSLSSLVHLAEALSIKVDDFPKREQESTLYQQHLKSKKENLERTEEVRQKRLESLKKARAVRSAKAAERRNAPAAKKPNGNGNAVSAVSDDRLEKAIELAIAALPDKDMAKAILKFALEE